MQVGFSSFNKPIYFKSGNSQTSPKKDAPENKTKPLVYTGLGVLALSIGLLGRKNSLKNVKPLEKEMPTPDFFHYLLPEEKPVVEKMIKEGLDIKLAEIFTKLKNIEDKETFAKETYDALLEYAGYKHPFSKPPLETGGWEKGASASWNPISFKTKIYSDALNSPKFDIFNSLNHEIEHFKQDCSILRTEGLGAEALTNAIRKNVLKSMKEDAKKCKETFFKTPDELKEDDVESFFNFNRNKDLLRLNERHYREVYGVIPADSDEGKMAQKYIEATEKYTKVDHDASTGKKFEQEKLYMDNLLEKDAYAAGNKIKDAYQNFIIKLAEARQKKD